MSRTELIHRLAVQCPTCKGNGTVECVGYSEWEYDSHAPCPTCTTDRTALRGPGVVPENQMLGSPSEDA